MIGMMEIDARLSLSGVGSVRQAIAIDRNWSAAKI